MAYNLKMMTKSGRESVEKDRQDFINNAVNSIPENEADPTPIEKIQQDNLKTELTLQSEYLANAEKMSTLEAETNKRLIERTRVLKEQTLELAKQKTAIDEKVSDKVLDIRGDVELENQRLGDEGIPVKLKDVQLQITKIRKSLNMQDIIKDMKNLDNTSGTAFINLRKELNKIDTTNLDAKIGKIITKINQMGDSPDPAQLKKQIEALNLELDKTVKSSQSNLRGMVPDETRKKVDALTQDLREQIQAERDLAQAKREGKEA